MVNKTSHHLTTVTQYDVRYLPSQRRKLNWSPGRSRGGSSWSSEKNKPLKGDQEPAINFGFIGLTFFGSLLTTKNSQSCVFLVLLLQVSFLKPCQCP